MIDINWPTCSIERVIEERIYNNQNDEIYIDKKFNSYNSSPRNLSLKNNNIISLIKKYKEKNELKINNIKNNLHSQIDFFLI